MIQLLLYGTVAAVWYSNCCASDNQWYSTATAIIMVQWVMCLRQSMIQLLYGIVAAI